ncbi:tyrosine-type recombinase/integrase [Paenibacillus sp. Soil724D2]|uniref:tyrosine-type recombinase/integrase n=1 Tax=Paenibacillus sp. (strain Soil724D2) TaxID=1736392 RepID=UPI000714735D|nr:site-specific integrase [Paenibacillus sp. Soil724D2]KRE50638.1 hypothetical protein ASG85_20515 [Paenibacillus sp. Soil724D2]
MLYAEQLQPENQNTENNSRLGPQGINQWIWENRVQHEIPTSLLREYLKQNMTNSPLVFLRKFEHVRDLLVSVTRFYQITIVNVQDQHVLYPEFLRYAAEHASKDYHCAHLFRFLVNTSIDLGSLDKKLSIAKVPPPQGLPLHSRILSYQAYLEQRGLSHEYIRHNVASIHHLFCWLCDNIRGFIETSPSQITISLIQNEHLLAFRTYQLKEVKKGSCSPVTFSHRIYAIRSFFSYLKERFGYASPLQRFRAICAPRYKPRDTPTDQQIESFFQVVDCYADNPILEQIGYRLLLDLGLRLSEAAKINWKDINLGTRTIVIRSKGKKSHTLPLAGRLYQLLIEAQKMLPSPCYLLGNRPQSIENQLYRKYKLYAMIAEWPFPGGVHFFRHIFVTRLAKRGILPQALKELARVKRLDTVSLYMHLGRQDRFMIDQINKLNYK